MACLCRSALATAFILALLAGCDEPAPDTTSPDLWKVLDRTVRAMETFHGSLDTGETPALSDADVAEFSRVLRQSLNAPPYFYDSAIGVALREDASVVGFRDLNGDTRQDELDVAIFTIEVDGENLRLIATDTTGVATGYRVGRGGFFAGAFIDSLLDRQRAAGVTPRAFAKRKVASRSEYAAVSGRSRPGAKD